MQCFEYKIEMDHGNLADAFYIANGDIVTNVNGQSISDVEDVLAILDDLQDDATSVAMTIKRRDGMNCRTRTYEIEVQ